MTTDSTQKVRRHSTGQATVDKEFTVLMRPMRPTGRTIPLHCHVPFEIALVRNGECTIVLPGEHRLLRRGNAFFVPSGFPHGFTCESPKGMQFAVIQFRHLHHELVRRLTNAHPLGVFTLSEADQTRFVELTYSLQREINSSLPYASIQAKALKHELVVLLLRSNECSNIRNLTQAQKELVENAINWMQNQCHNPTLSIDDVAKKVGLSSSHFRNLFHQFVGSSPKRYLTLLRLQTSKSLMLQGGYMLADVAFLAGFSSPEQFSKVFRHHIGFSPSEWRESHCLAQHH